MFVQRSKSLYVQRSESLYVYVKQLLFSDLDRCMCLLKMFVQRSESLYVQRSESLYVYVQQCVFSDRNRCTCMCVWFFVQRSESLYVCSNNDLPTFTTASIEIQLITVGPRRRGIYNSSTTRLPRRIASHSITTPHSDTYGLPRCSPLQALTRGLNGSN
jgi:hypothetical protein